MANKKTSKTSKTYRAIKPVAELLLSGKVLSIDPSTGSKSSQPGFAWFEKGELIESGMIEINHTLSSSTRLFSIAESIRTEFEEPDILLVEGITLVMYKGSKMNMKAMASLQKAIGAIIGARPFKHVIEIPSSAWRHHKPENYDKTDEMDAISIGFCAINTALSIIEDN